MGPFPGMHEAAECGTHVRLISTDGEDLTEAYSPQEPFTDDPFTTPTKTEDYNGEDVHPDEPVTDHRKWCTRCKLLGHYAADCTTAVLSGGVVSVPVVPRLGDPALIDNACSAADGYAPHAFVWNSVAGESQCVACGEDNPVQPAPATHIHTDSTGVERTHPGGRDECELLECCTHPNGFGFMGCPCGASDPEQSGLTATPEPAQPLPYPGSPGSITDPAQNEPDPFTTPTVPAPEVNVSGQPNARYEWHGKQNRGYLVKLPETGDFRRYKNGKPKGLTRATTFNKAATDQNALTDWAKRNVLIGASKRPDLVARAHGLTHEDNRDQLMKLVAELETTAGAKVSADIGTLVHELTERLDGGPSFGFDQVPAQYRSLLMLYRAELAKAGLRPVPGLIERTTYIPEFGGVVGTLDRVYYHEPSGQYVIGDVKTGKTLKYGMDEIETQEWIYAHGVNLNGVYDWNADVWQFAHDGCLCTAACSPPYTDCQGPNAVQVSEEWGVVVHMPVQGDDAGKVMLVRADLQRGKRHAEVCHDVRVQRANKPTPEAWTGDELKAPETATPAFSVAQLREDAFRCVTSKEHAAQLWQEAYDAGVPPEEMERLKELADARLAELAEQPCTGGRGALSWDVMFSGVGAVGEAGELWEEARAAGVPHQELGRLVGLAQQRLRELGIPG